MLVNSSESDMKLLWRLFCLKARWLWINNKEILATQLSAEWQLFLVQLFSV